MKNEKKVDIEQANKIYFQSLANTRASASMMLISFAGVFVLLMWELIRSAIGSLISSSRIAFILSSYFLSH